MELLKSQTGGYIQYEAFQTDSSTIWAEDYTNVNELYGIGTEMSILDSSNLIEEYDLLKNIILISGDWTYTDCIRLQSAFKKSICYFN